MVGSLFRIYTFTVQAQAGFRWVTIPDGVEIEGSEVFDPVVMKRLYALGARKGTEGPPWYTDLPGLRYQPAR